MHSDSKNGGLPNRNARTGALEGAVNAGEEDLWKLPQKYDLIVIGGGINGTGIARDAAERGLTVLLLEKADFGAGTTAYSSRLIHGGLRYLANLEVDLVYESLKDRELLLQNAPHLVRPLAMAIPIYRHSQKPRWMVWCGMMLYDLLSWGKRMPSHQMLGRASFLKKYPAVNPDGLQGGAIYYDAQVAFPERVCVENAIAARESGKSTLLNHAKVNRFLIDKGASCGVYFTDLLTSCDYTAHGKVIINASGPWVDSVLREALGETSNASSKAYAAHLIGGTKGSHIIVRRFAGGPETALYVEARSDGRPFFIIPWQDDYYLIGTTDLHYSGDPDGAIADCDEVAYLLAETNQVLPKAGLTEKDVLYTYSGIRPLPYAEGKKAGKITRKHLIADHGRDERYPIQGLLSIIGGKLTTYRNLAEEAVDYMLKMYPRMFTGNPAPKTTTRTKALPGGEGIQDIEDYKRSQSPAASQQFGIPEAMVGHLIDLYGSRYRQVLELLLENPAWGQPLREGSLVMGAQVIYAVRYEMACTLSDVMLRRIECGLAGDLGINMLDAVARLMATERQWPEEKMRTEVAEYMAYIQGHNLAFKAQQERGLCPSHAV